MTSPQSSWSPETMLERIGGDDELARQLVDLFLEDYPRTLGELRDSVAAGGAEQIRRAAHAFKGSVANFVDGGPMATALAIEMQAREERLSEVPTLMARLETEVSQLVAGMRAFAEDPSCRS